VKTYNLTVEKNPNGYSSDTWGYIVKSNDGSAVWNDGGYKSEQDASEAGRELIKKLESDDY
jgi:hypothetical protein